MNSGNKHVFKYEKRCYRVTEFSMAVDSKKNILNFGIRWIRESLIQCYIVKVLSIHYRAKSRRLRL